MIRSHALWTAALLTTSLVGGLIYNWPSDSPEETTEQVDEETAIDADEGLPSADPTQGFTLTEVTASPKTELASLELDPLKEGDNLLLGGNAIGAYQKYNRLPNEIVRAMDASVLIRLALSAEQAGFLDRSEQHYRDAIGKANKGSIQQVWGMIGTARIWEAQDRLDEAISLLSELYLMYAGSDYPNHIRLPISRQLGDCLQKRILGTAIDHLIDSETDPASDLKKQLQYFWCQAQLEPVLDDSPWQRPSREPKSKDMLTVVQHPIDDVTLIFVNAQSSMYPLSQLIGDLQRSTKMKFDVSALARSTLSGRSIRIDAVGLPVSLLLDQALGAHDLAWEQNQGTVKIVHTDQWKPKRRAIATVQRAQRLQRQLQIQFPGGVQRIAAVLHDANNSFLLGESGAAAEKYLSARELDPTGELNAYLHYNNASFALSQGEQEPALNDFYLALDQTLSPALQGKAYSHIGEIEILQGRPERAIVAASRGLRLASDVADSNRSLMALAKAYLLMNDAYSANQILFNHQSSLTDERSKRLATVLSTHARYEAIEPTDGLQNEGERLVMSLASLQPNDPRDFVEHLMVSRAFYAVGFRSKAIEHLSVAAKAVPTGYWQSRVPIELAEILYQTGELQRASETLAAVTENDDMPMKIRALFLDANIQTELKQPAVVEQRCNQLLRLPLSEDQQKQALQVLGKSYQSTGQHYAAALCFAGLLPDGEAARASLSSSNDLRTEQ